jgi:ABC-type nickel/cobalt efflux system permease component RcnA
MSMAVWVLQVLLALAFLLAGVTKASQPRQRLAASMGWVEDFSDTGVRTIGCWRSWRAWRCCCRR